MLVLSRKPGQSIEIGPNVRLTVIDSRPGKVRLGFEAPREVEIVRTELGDDDPPTDASESASAADPVPLPTHRRKRRPGRVA